MVYRGETRSSGAREDLFFATVFLGSGILFVALIFLWAATIGAIYGAYDLAIDQLTGGDIFIFGFIIMKVIISNFALRMAGIYVTSVGTIWTRSGVMPRWLSIFTFIVAAGFLLFAGSVKEARSIFPLWVLVVSVYILILNYRIDTREIIELQAPRN